MKNFKELLVWQKAHQLTLRIYEITQPFPKDEVYGLTSQIRRATVSIPANIAEGCGRGGDIEMARFFQISMGSASELEYFLLLIRDLKLIAVSDYEVLEQDLIEIKRMLNAFIQKLKANG